jgi:capsular exopolysaccharide synthesis family protein
MIRLGATQITDAPAVARDESPVRVGPLRARTAPSGGDPSPTLMEESFRTLRTNLLLRRESDTRTFVFTSAMPSEGKSTITANLACSLAALHKRVLLIDADLRRSAAHRFFGVTNSVGLVDVLQGRVAAPDVWQETSHGPFVLTSGPATADPQTLFESDQFSRLMSEVRRQFDFVLIDSAPLLAVADTTLLVPHVDGTILVLKYGIVSESEASLSVERLRAARAKVIGCVLSQVTDADVSFHSYAREYVTSR